MSMFVLLAFCVCPCSLLFALNQSMAKRTTLLPGISKSFLRSISCFWDWNWDWNWDWDWDWDWNRHQLITNCNGNKVKVSRISQVSQVYTETTMTTATATTTTIITTAQSANNWTIEATKTASSKWQMKNKATASKQSNHNKDNCRCCWSCSTANIPDNNNELEATTFSIEPQQHNRTEQKLHQQQRQCNNAKPEAPVAPVTGKIDSLSVFFQSLLASISFHWISLVLILSANMQMCTILLYSVLYPYLTFAGALWTLGQFLELVLLLLLPHFILSIIASVWSHVHCFH